VPDGAEAVVTGGVLLLVEDDPDHAFLVRRRLSKHRLGLAVEHLTTAAEASARLAAHGDARCVVLDLSLPDARGTDALHAVREADPRTAALPPLHRDVPSTA
jgi:CheY-like chemotaxis protein